MGILARWRERRAIRRAFRLRKRLRRLYGRSETYKPGQIRRAARADGLKGDGLNWAFAIHCSEDGFAEAGAPGDYAALRKTVDEVGLKEPIGLDQMEGVPLQHERAISEAGGGSFSFGGGGDGGGGGGDGGGGGGGI
ncbi:MAG: hypothetical protein AAGM38_16625 [Pseudomonadota bacterium]